MIRPSIDELLQWLSDVQVMVETFRMGVVIPNPEYNAIREILENQPKYDALVYVATKYHSFPCMEWRVELKDALAAIRKAK